MYIPTLTELSDAIRSMQGLLSINNSDLVKILGISRPTVIAIRRGKASYNVTIKAYQMLEELTKKEQKNG
jgi:DNA-binding XRE family transcriptional regulator